MIGYHMPTRVHIEPGCLDRLPEVARSLFLESALLVVDPGLMATEWPERARRSLVEIGIRAVIFDAVEPNPRTSTAARAVEAIEHEEIDGVIALGGGSVLDAAKAAAMLATNGGRVEHYEGKNRYHEPPLPFVAIPSTCGTGSEVTWVSVLTHEPTRTKISVKGESMFPQQALVDADLIRTLPRGLVATTGFDALTHAIEATTCSVANSISDALAEKAIALLFRFLPRAVADIAGDTAAREAAMRASTLAGLAFGNADVAGVHCLSEAIGGLLDVPHGLANAVLLPPVLRYHKPVIVDRLANLDKLTHAGDGSRPHAEDRAERFLARLEDMGKVLEIPPFAELGVSRDDFPDIAERAVRNGSNGSNPQPMSVASYLEILEGVAAE